MIIKVRDKFFRGFGSEYEKRLPIHLTKVNFEPIDIEGYQIVVRVIGHPAFTTKRGFMFKQGYGRTYSGKAMGYVKDELVGMEYKLSRELFDREDIEKFIEWNKGEVF